MKTSLIAVLLFSLGVSSPVASGAPAVEVSEVKQARNASGGEKLLEKAGRAAARTLTAEEKVRVVELVKPWVGRVLSRGLRPDWESVGWKYVSDPEVGDLFIGEYKIGETTVLLVDTSTVLLVELRNSSADVPPPNREVEQFALAAGDYFDAADDVADASRLYVWRAPDAVYISPIYPSPVAGEKAGWRHTLSVRFAKGSFLLVVTKLVDGEHPAEGGFGIRTRVSRFSDVVRGLGREALMKQIGAANAHELSVVLENWDVREATPGEICERVVARQDISSESLVTVIVRARRRVEKKEEVARLFETLVDMSNDGKIKAPVLLGVVKKLASSDSAELRVKLLGLKDEGERTRVLAQLKTD